MRLYAGSSKNFIDLNLKNQISELLRQEFMKAFGFNPSTNEVMSWRNSLLRMALIMQGAKLDDNGVFVEFQLPSSAKRIDVMITGRDAEANRNSVLVELKQWDRCTLTDYDSEYVVTWVGGGNRNALHPSVQVGLYKQYLEDNSEVFYTEDNPVILHACAYLHNYNYFSTDPIFDARFSFARERYPVYTADDTDGLTEYLHIMLGHGAGMEILSEIENSKLRPSTKLLAQVSGVIKEKLKGELKLYGQHLLKADYVLLDEQMVVYDTVMSIIRNGLADKQKFVVIVKGGAGTGKSVIALQLLADLTATGYNAQYATGSKSFTETLRKILGTSSSSLFKYFMSFGKAESNSIDVLINDEAHRIREKTGYPFPATGKPQVEDLINVAKVSLFFIDDHQAVRKGEIGSSDFIRDNALRLNCKVFEYELEAQFRCGGSDGYINWIDNTLNIKRTANALWADDPNFEFKIFDSPDSLEEAIREKHSDGYSARMTAGFCWEWSNSLNPDNSLINDVNIGTYSRPWNAREGLTGMKRGIPKSQFWAYDDGGLDQIGCIYTSQGFEFDYIGVIFGKDLTYNFDIPGWEGHPKLSYDNPVKNSGNFLQLVKNTYRVLLTRGMKGCYVHFMDKDTEKYFKSRIEN